MTRGLGKCNSLHVAPIGGAVRFLVVQCAGAVAMKVRRTATDAMP
jgi:hypothetical protein